MGRAYKCPNLLDEILKAGFASIRQAAVAVEIPESRLSHIVKGKLYADEADKLKLMGANIPSSTFEAIDVEDVMESSKMDAEKLRQMRESNLIPFGIVAWTQEFEMVGMSQDKGPVFEAKCLLVDDYGMYSAIVTSTAKDRQEGNDPLVKEVLKSVDNSEGQ